MNTTRRLALALTAPVFAIGALTLASAPAQAAQDRPDDAGTPATSSLLGSALIDGPLIEGPLIDGGILNPFFGNFMDNRG